MGDKTEYAAKDENLMVVPSGTIIKINGISLNLTEDVFVSSHPDNLRIVQKYLGNIPNKTDRGEKDGFSSLC